MARTQQNVIHSTETNSLADLLERILDKGIVIAGDIKVNLVDVELLTIQIRLVIASVDKAREMGMDWWLRPEYCSGALNDRSDELDQLKVQVAELEQKLTTSQQ